MECLSNNLAKVQSHLNAVDPHTPPLLSVGSGIVRVIKNEIELKNWQKAAVQHPDWLQLLPADPYHGDALAAVRIKRAGVVDCPRYLCGLWDYLSSNHDKNTKNISWRKASITLADVDRLSHEFDAVLLSCGAALPRLHDTDGQSLLNVKLVRGQNLFLRPQSPQQKQQKDALLCGEYLVPKTIRRLDNSALWNAFEDGQYLLGGATHEYISHYDPQLHDLPDLAVAQQMLRSRLAVFCPSVAEMSVMTANAAVRLVSPRNKFGKVQVFCFVFFRSLFIRILFT